MAHLGNLSAVIGLLLPLLIAVIQQMHWKASYRAVVGFVVCFVAAILTTWLAGKLDAKNLTSSFFIVFTVAQVSYAQFWKKVGVTQAIEQRTPPREEKQNGIRNT